MRMMGWLSLLSKSTFCSMLLRGSCAFTNGPRCFHFRQEHFDGRCSGNPGSLLSSAIASGDTVLVIGGTGGVGQLVTQKLVNRGLDLTVRATCRDRARGEETIGDASVQVMQLDLVTGDDKDSSLQAALEDVSAIVISVGTTAFPTTKWFGGNTPEAIDKVAVMRIAQAAAGLSSLKKVVLVTSVGVERPDQMPFKILNLFGVIDAKRAGEEAVMEAACDSNFDYVLVRPGRLIGGPFTNLDVARLLQIEGGAENGVDLAVGDVLLGDCKRDACAEAVVQCLSMDECQNVAFSIVSNEDKPALNDAQWREAFVQMKESGEVVAS